jgi:hypothetical protein
MSHSDPLMSALSECEAAARQHGHALGLWHAVDERLHASLCKDCGRMAWLTRSGSEQGWRIGGSALGQECLGGGEDVSEDRRSVSGD